MAGYSQTWAELICPKCSSSNFLNHGDIRDDTGFDPESCKCWKCKCCFDYEGEIIDDEEEQEFCEVGRNLRKK